VTVTRTGAGDFLLTFDKEWPDLISATGTVQMSTATDIIVQFGDLSLTGKTLVLRTVVAAVETDIAADANNRVNYLLCFKNSSGS
jgi:hypothetical protein